MLDTFEIKGEDIDRTSYKLRVLTLRQNDRINIRNYIERTNSLATCWNWLIFNFSFVYERILKNVPFDG